LDEQIQRLSPTVLGLADFLAKNAVPIPNTAPTPTLPGSESGPDPETTTRLAYTEHHLLTPCPEYATPQYRKLWESLQRLMKLLIEHPAMDQNRQINCYTPAVNKNKVYFMYVVPSSHSSFTLFFIVCIWFAGSFNVLILLCTRRWDFVGRTWGMLFAVDANNPQGMAWLCIVTRAYTAMKLIRNPSEKIDDLMMAVGYIKDDGIEFTAAMKKEARKLDVLP
jgi:hypothetical protein